MQVSIGSECRSSLLAELSQAKELMMQLEAHFDMYSTTEFCKTLTPKILSSLEKSIYMAKSYNPDVEQKQQHNYSSLGPGEFVHSSTNSPRSEDSDHVFKDCNSKEMCKKRKTQPKWTTQVRLGVGVGAPEGSVDDGFSWRKYGQKDILGAKYPRSYYRCTHRNTQGCAATKQVQRSDEDPQVFDITYNGTHTCLGGNQSSAALARSGNLQQQSYCNGDNQQFDGQNQDLLLSFQTDLKVKTEGLSYDDDQNSISFAFGSRPVVGVSPDMFFSPPSTPDNSLIRSCPSFVSPTTSESTYFSVSPCSRGSFEPGHKLQTSESDVAETILVSNSSFNSTVQDMDYMLDLDMNFNFDCLDDPSFFP